MTTKLSSQNFIVNLYTNVDIFYFYFYLNIKFKKLVAKNHIFESTHSALSQHKLKFKRKMWSQIEDMAFEQLTKQLTVNISQIKRIVFFAYTLVPMVAT